MIHCLVDAGACKGAAAWAAGGGWPPHTLHRGGRAGGQPQHRAHSAARLPRPCWRPPAFRGLSQSVDAAVLDSSLPLGANVHTWLWSGSVTESSLSAEQEFTQYILPSERTARRPFFHALAVVRKCSGQNIYLVYKLECSTSRWKARIVQVMVYLIRQE